MKNLYKIVGVLSKTGLALEVIDVPVLKESDTAIVLDTSDFSRVQKGEGESSYFKDFLGVPYITEHSTKGILEAKAYYEDKQMGKELLKKAVSKFLVQKASFYTDLSAKI